MTKSKNQSLDASGRFLSELVERSLEQERRTPEDFLRHFTPETIMVSLEEEPDLRADVLSKTTGVRRAIAVRKTPESSAQDLELALETGETDAAMVVSLVSADDCARHFDRKKLWAFISEAGDDDRSGDHKASDAGATYLTTLINCALREELVTPRGVIEAIGVDTLVKHLPSEMVVATFKSVLDAGHSQEPYDEERLLADVPTSALAENLPAEHLWSQLIEPEIAFQNQLLGGNGADRPKKATAKKAAKKPVAKKAEPKRAEPSKAAPAASGDEAATNDEFDVDEDLLLDGIEIENFDFGESGVVQESNLD